MDTTGYNDAELVASALVGNREAFEPLYDRHARMVRAVVAAVSGDWPAVEDMTQETFLRAYRNLGRLEEPQKFGSWVVGIARQVGRERRRTLRRDRHEYRDPRLTETAATTDGKEVVEQQDEIRCVLQRLAELPDEERLAVHTFFFDEQSARQAAEVVGLSRSGFYALLQRALARLAALCATPESREQSKN
jgi:RNA polymerase sigma-70 factor (ECF subfamily)